MADPKTTLERLIEEHGGKLVRNERHKVFKFPNGQVFTTASTPECPRAYRNANSNLKNLLNLHPPDRGVPGERREKRVKRKHEGSKPLPLETNKIKQGEWKEKLEAVKPVLPARPSAKQRPMSSAKISRRARPVEITQPVEQRPGKVIHHPVHNSRPTVSTRPPVAIEGLMKRFAK